MDLVVKTTYPDDEVVTTTYNAQGLPLTLEGDALYVGSAAYNALGQVKELGFGSGVISTTHLYEGEEWLDIKDAVGDLTQKFLCLNEVYPKGFSVPKRFIGENIIHLPTVKTHVFTTTTGAMKNAFGGLLSERRHWTHSVIHETLVDLLAIQTEIHPGIFAVMDATIGLADFHLGGAHCDPPVNRILAGADARALDRQAATLLGLDWSGVDHLN